MVPPDMHDFRKGITAALQKIFGIVGASKFVWSVEPLDKNLEQVNTFRIKITLDDPSDKISRDRFYAGVATTRVVANDRVVMRVLEYS